MVLGIERGGVERKAMVVGGGYSFVKNVAEVVEYYFIIEIRLQKSLV